MSEESEDKVVSRDMIKTLTLGSGEKIIAYIKGVTELGSYITERPFTIHIDEEGSYYLVQYNPYAAHEHDFIFQSLGVVGISNVSEWGKDQYIAAVRAEVVQDAKLSGLIDKEGDFDSVVDVLQSKLKDAFGEDAEIQLDMFESVEEPDTDNVVDLSSWKPDTDPN